MIKTIKENIKREIKARGKTEGQICDILKQDRRYFYFMTDEVKLSKIIEIAQAIGCNPEDLIRGV